MSNETAGWEENDAEENIDLAVGRRRRKGRNADPDEAAELAHVALLNRLGIADVDGIVIRDVGDIGGLDDQDADPDDLDDL